MNTKFDIIVLFFSSSVDIFLKYSSEKKYSVSWINYFHEENSLPWSIMYQLTDIW